MECNFWFLVWYKFKYKKVDLSYFYAPNPTLDIDEVHMIYILGVPYPPTLVGDCWRKLRQASTHQEIARCIFEAAENLLCCLCSWSSNLTCTPLCLQEPLFWTCSCCVSRQSTTATPLLFVSTPQTPRRARPSLVQKRKIDVF